MKNKYWIKIDNCKYDIESWKNKHPGGKEILLKHLGKDVSDQFYAFHNQETRKYLKSFLIENLEENKKIKEVDLDYRKLREKLWKEGYFNYSKSYYFNKILIIFSFFLFGLIFLYNKYNLIFSSLFIGISLQQSAFIAHDLLHNSIKTKFNYIFGWFIGTVVFGISSEMWKYEHNLHHSITLRPREDPQFNMLPIFMISMKEIIGPKKFKLNKLSLLLISIQHYTLIPICLIIGRINLCFISLIYVIENLKKTKIFIDLIGILIHWFWFGSLINYFIEENIDKILFYLLFSCFVGILHIQLLLNHIGKESFMEYEEKDIGFFEYQLRTSRNIECTKYENWFHGGLEYQIEHHLFPKLPRHNLHLVKPFIIELCKKHDIKYESVSFFTALKKSLNNFKDISCKIVNIQI